jgi:hypothetical protein
MEQLVACVGLYCVRSAWVAQELNIYAKVTLHVCRGWLGGCVLVTERTQSERKWQYLGNNSDNKRLLRIRHCLQEFHLLLTQ